jgi:threonine/homoserine/homoserine lactone efflux protein
VSTTVRILINGLLTGLFLQLAIGPVFFYIFKISLESNFTTALSAILAVTLVDYLYIALSILGLGRILENNKAKKITGIIGSSALILFGTSILFSAFAAKNPAGGSSVTGITPLGSFVSCFILTLSSPLTIVFWSSIFTTKVLENGYDKKQVMVFGLGSGASTFIFLATAMFILSLVRSGIPDMVVSWLNVVVGALLVAYGVKRTAQTLVPRMASRS